MILPPLLLLAACPALAVRTGSFAVEVAEALPEGSSSLLEANGTLLTDTALAAELQRRQQAFGGTVLRERYVLEKLRRIRPIPGWVAPEISGFTLRTHLGLGGYGDVWKAYDRKTGQSVALKLLYRGWSYISKAGARPGDRETLRQSEHECRTVMQITADAATLPPPESGWGRYFCRCLADHIDNGGQPSFLVFEDCGDAALSRQPDGRSDARAALQQARKVATGLVRGIAVLNRLKPAYMHHDLKPENLCVDGKGEAKIVDWGAAVRLEGHVRAVSLVGTPPYMPPEAMNAATVYQGEPWTYDVYSAGLVFLQLLCPEVTSLDWFNPMRPFLATSAFEAAKAKCRWLQGTEDVALAAAMASKAVRERPSPWAILETLEKLR